MSTTVSYLLKIKGTPKKATIQSLEKYITGCL